MRKAIAALLLLSVSFSVNATTITVEGFGSDAESAKRDAFRTAIENVCGTTVLSDREHFNDKTTLDKVTTYSSCNVKTYKVLEQNEGRVKMTVDVQPNDIAQRLQPSADNRHFVDQANLQAQTSTFKEEQIAGKQLLEEVFRDFPKTAFTIKSKVDIVTDNYGKSYLKIAYDVAWNYNFVKSLIDTLESYKIPHLCFGCDARDYPYNLSIHWKKPTSRFFYEHDNYLIRDNNKINQIFNYFYQYGSNNLRLKISARNDTGKTIKNGCYLLPDGYDILFGRVNGFLEIYGNSTVSREEMFSLNFPAQDIYDVSVSVVSSKECIGI